MKKGQYLKSRTIKELYELKRKGVPFVIWHVNSKDLLEEVQRHFKTEEWVSCIQTRSFRGIANKPAIIKAIHYDRLHGKRYRHCRLSYTDKKVLHSYNVPYWASTHKITLNSK